MIRGRAAQRIGEASAPPELTDAYHHSRHLLAFLSGLLLTWDYLGLAFEGAPEGLFGLKVSIAHPSTPAVSRSPACAHCKGEDRNESKTRRAAEASDSNSDVLEQCVHDCLAWRSSYEYLLVLDTQ